MSHAGAPRFNPANAARLHDPMRLEKVPPALLWHLAAVPDARVIVDIGAGTGLFAAEFARLAPSAEVRAVDGSAEMLEWLREHLPPDLARRVRPVLAEVTRVPLPSAEADLVVMIALYHELGDAPAALAEAHRLLRPTGRLLVVDWKKQPTPTGPPMEHRVTAEAIAAAVSEAGFADVETDEVTLEEFSIVTATRGAGG